jgi:hypothetical protein
VKSLMLAIFAFPAAAFAAEAALPAVSAICQSQAQQIAHQCPIGAGASAFLQCKAHYSSLVSPHCSAELKAHITALAAACRADRAPTQFGNTCPAFKAHSKAFVSGN